MYCVSGSARLSFEIRGHLGPPVLLLHGLGGASAVWCEIPDELARRHQVLVPDLRGCGRSERGIEPYSLRLLAHDIFAVLDAAAVTRCHVVGHSLGGVIAQEAILQRPDTFVSVTLISTSGRVGDKAASAWRRLADRVEVEGLSGSTAPSRGFSEGFAVIRPEIVARMAALTAACDPRVYAEQARIAADYDYSGRFKDVDCPVLVLQGLADRMTKPGGAVLLAREFPLADLELVEGVGHNLHLEMGPAFAERLEAFFKNASTRQRPAAPK
jgi:3-oxoadipate enol-lactonase/4-carboxymuconolactone decarboxylase